MNFDALLQVASQARRFGGTCFYLRSSRHPDAKLWVSSTSSIVLERLNVGTLEQIAVDATLRHCKRYRDQGWFMLLLALVLVKCLQGTHIILALEALAHGAKRVEAEWHAETLPFDDLPKLLACLEPFFRKPALRIKDPRQTALLIADAFLRALPATVEETPNIRYLWLVGMDTDACRLENGLFLDTPVYGMPPDLLSTDPGKGKLKTLVLNVNVTLAELALQVVGSPYAERRTFVRNFFQKLEKAWAAAKIDIILCQKQMDPILVRRLVDRGMVVFTALSIRHIEAVKAATNGKIASWIDPSQDWGALCGSLSSVKIKFIRGRRYSWIPSQCVTLLIGAPDEATMDEMKVAVLRSMNSLIFEAMQGASYYDGSAELKLLDIFDSIPLLRPATDVLRKHLRAHEGFEFGRAKRHAVLASLDLAGVLLRINRVL